MFFVQFAGPMRPAEGTSGELPTRDFLEAALTGFGDYPRVEPHYPRTGPEHIRRPRSVPSEDATAFDVKKAMKLRAQLTDSSGGVKKRSLKAQPRHVREALAQLHSVGL